MRLHKISQDVYVMIFKLSISLVAASAIVLHALFPHFRIDAITIGLLVVGIIPWLSKVIDSFELPGGWKLKFRDLEQAAARAEKAGMLSDDISKKDENRYSFQSIGESDPNLALAGLRIEIEKRLKTLAEKNGIGTRMQSARRLLQMLAAKKIVTAEEQSVFEDMILLLNAAVHGARIDARAYAWAMKYGPGFLKSLDAKISPVKKNQQTAKKTEKTKKAARKK
jgi:hypothetical protein